MFDLQPCDQAGHYLWKKKKTKFSHSYYSINEIRWWQIKNTPKVHLCACKFTGRGRCEGVEVSTIMDWGKYHTPFGWL